MNKPDLLSDVFSTLRLKSNLYFQTALKGKYAVRLPLEKRHIRFHMVQEGACYLTVANRDPVHLLEGDVALVPDGAEQILSSQPNVDPLSLQKILAAGHLRDGVLDYGKGTSVTRILCGFYQFDEATDHPVLTNLPEQLIIKKRDFGQEPWILETLRLISLEMDLNGQGMQGVLERLLEILFIQFTRIMARNQAVQSNGFIAALSDVHLSKALYAMHNEPHLPWKTSDLAKLSGMSRTRFSDQFTTMVGMPPIGYLTTWRLIKARSLLCTSTLDMTEIANRCGYASMPSFSSRFKKTFSVGPGAYRRAIRFAE